MIGSLRGTLLERNQLNEVLVEVVGVGYRVTVSPATVVELGEPDDEVFLYIHHHRREDAETLYGFPTRDERVCFEALLGAHGVGPALALAILSVHAPGALRQVLAEDDLSALCLVPGVGKKTAARLLVELKSRLDIPELDLTVAVPGAARRRRPSRPPPRPGPTCARPSPASATNPTRSWPCSASCPTATTRPPCCAAPCSASPWARPGDRGPPPHVRRRSRHPSPAVFRSGLRAARQELRAGSARRLHLVADPDEADLLDLPDLAGGAGGGGALEAALGPLHHLRRSR